MHDQLHTCLCRCSRPAFIVPGAAHERPERQTLHLDVLSTQERLVIMLRYDLDGEPHSQGEVARLTGLHRGTVRRIEARALHKLSERKSAE